MGKTGSIMTSVQHWEHEPVTSSPKLSQRATRVADDPLHSTISHRRKQRGAGCRPIAVDDENPEDWCYSRYLWMMHLNPVKKPDRSQLPT